jgi:N,N'-diacetyllegionaminate synthase
MSKVHIIAEAGSNYNGDINYAKKLIDIAATLKVDSVKFQIINTYGLYLPGKYEYGNYDIKDVLNFRDKCMLKDSEWLELSNYSSNLGIPLTASVFDKKSLDLYMKMNPPYIKIASGDLNNLSFLRQVSECNKPMILSTGMATLGEIENSVNDLTKHNFSKIILMHCTSIYPATLEQSNLYVIDVLKSAFGFEVGFSDHTGTSHAACMAMAKGATWFEKHFTFDNTLDGLDHKHAQDEAGFRQYVSDLKNAQKALTIPKNKVSEGEILTKKRARRGVYAAHNIKKGKKIEYDDILIVRPENDINVKDIDKIIGGVADEDINMHEPISWNMLKLSGI